MKSVRAAMVSVVCAIAMGTAHAGPINLLSNPSFEDDFSSWSVSAGSAVYVVDSLTVQDGMKSARGEESQRGSLGRLFQDVTSLVEFGGSYVISGWIKTDAVSTDGGGVVLGLDFVDAFGVTPSNGYVMEIGAISGTNDWAFFKSDPFSLPSQKPTGTDALWFLMDFNDSSGNAWVDGLALTRASVPEPGTFGLLGIGLLTLTFARRKAI